MSIEGKDLERAGTRSRRTLSNAKPFYLHDSQDPSVHPYGKRSANVFSRRPRPVILILVTILMLCIVYLSKSHLHTTPRPLSKPEFTFEDSLIFKDSTQLTDYTHINKLLSEKKVPSSTKSQQEDLDVIAPGQNEFIRNLSQGSISGHTFDQLRRLTNNIPIPYSTVSKQQHRRVPVTAIIHTTSVAQLYIQVQSVLTQTALPEYIWIICDTLQKAEAEARIMTLDRRRVKMMVTDDVEGSFEWLKITGQASTDYVWVIDQNIAPGKRYLENTLKLSLTKQYKSALLGTEAAIFNQGKTECSPDSMHSASRQMKSKPVDVIHDSWLLQRSWIPYLLDAMTNENTMETSDTNPIVGLFISRVLYMNAGIPSIALPTDPIERAYWGDIRLQKTQKSETCRLLQTFVTDHAGNLQDVYYRHGVDISSTPVPIAMYADSKEALSSLAPLLCRFEQQEQVELHLLARNQGYQQIKSSISTLCSKNQTNVFIHDLSMSHKLSKWASINDLLHRMTRILSVVQPHILIHSIGKENECHSSMLSSTKIAQITSIYLPTQDIPHALWMTELPISTLAKWNSFSIKIMINTDKRSTALQRTLESLDSAHYLGDETDLSILMDYTADTVTQTLANDFNWKKGIKYVRHRIAATNKPPQFSESWYPANNDEYAIILNNDIELSRYFYTWAKYAILRYRYMEKPKNLFGISLYAPKLIETDPHGRRWFNPSKILAENGYQEQSHEPFVMQWPSYSGAVYFPEHWREYHDYITARTADKAGFKMQEVLVPGLRSNEWNRSWRRYFEELIYLRSYVMLFPNFEGASSLSTLHLELKKRVMREQYVDAVSIFNVPLMDQDKIVDVKLRDFDDLPVFDIWGKLANHKELKKRGLELHDEISACPAPLLEQEEHTFDPTDLLCPFARIVTVELENEKDPLPVLEPFEITVYN